MRRLDVEVAEPAPVEVIEGEQDRLCDLEDALDGIAGGSPGHEVQPRDPLQHEVGAISVDHELMDGDQAGVVEGAEVAELFS